MNKTNSKGVTVNGRQGPELVLVGQSRISGVSLRIVMSLGKVTHVQSVGTSAVGRPLESVSLI